MATISMVQFFVLLNGTLGRLFTYCQGIWQGDPIYPYLQGDPLCPYLFIIVVEVLGRNLKALANKGKIKCIRLASSIPL